MTGHFELMIEGKGVTPHSVSIGEQPFSIGRSPENNLVVPDGLVSWQHLKLWADSGKLWVSDAGSTNGTFVNGERVKGTKNLTPGDRITIGDALKVQVLLQGEFPEPSVAAAVALEEVETGLRHPFRAGNFVIGSSAQADLRIPEASEFEAKLLAHASDDIWMVQGDNDIQVEMGQEIEIGGMKFKLVEIDATRQPTINPQPDRFPYCLTATLDGPTGPFAQLENLHDGTSCRIEAETRAILLYLLGSRVVKDQQAATLAPSEWGWCPDDDVIVGVWGRSGLADGANRLKVLVHRLRAEIRKSGFDPWFIERRRRYIRARVKSVKLLG